MVGYEVTFPDKVVTIKSQGYPQTTLQFNTLYSTARSKLHARKYIFMSANTFSPSSQAMLASKGSMLSSKGNMLSCMILLTIEVDARVQLVARIRHRAVSRCTRARLHALVHYFTRDLNLMLTDITRQAFIKCLLAILIHEQ